MATQMVKGNTAVIIGAMYAGCDCYFGYPITPARRNTPRTPL
jgi:ketoisovalerate ferredoxin oxidoreductase, alpha subunit (EC 1.2.7.7)